LKKFIFTLDLEADHASFADQYNIFKDKASIHKVLRAISDRGVPITVFVVGKVIEDYPEIIEIFTKFNSEFQLHSYSHRKDLPDSSQEIEQGIEAFTKYFGSPPEGYRAPCGLISNEGMNRLKQYGFIYDSSIFPSWYPNPFKYLGKSNQPYIDKSSNLLEIPFTTFGPARLVLSASYLKLLGFNTFNIYSKIFDLPNIICFDSHLHDYLSPETTFKELPLFWQIIFSRNRKSGLDLTKKFFDLLESKDFKFCKMSEVVKNYLPM